MREGRLRGRPSRRALRTPDYLLRLGLSPGAKVLDLKSRIRAADAERGDELSFRSSGASERMSRAVPFASAKSGGLRVAGARVVPGSD
jgi:hypothetical protein